MKICLEIVNPSDWAKLSENAHKFSFGIERPADMDRLSFALITRKDSGELLSYATLIELDKDSVYMQHGGAFPEAEKSVLALRSYLMMINYLKEEYKHVATRIWNQRKAMLKLAWAAGFTITGLDTDLEGNIFLIHSLGGKK